MRRLRIAAGLSQTQLAAGRFSKEYVSQIERGKTRPTPDTLVWLGERLGADTEFLATGVSSVERYRWEAALARGEALVEQRRYDEAVLELEASLEAARELGAAEPHRPGVRRDSRGRGWSSASSRPRSSFCSTPAPWPRGRRSSDVERADILFRLGVCRYKLSSIATAAGLLDEALSSRSDRAIPAIACAPRSCSGAPAATGISATTSPPARTWSARSSSPRR